MVSSNFPGKDGAFRLEENVFLRYQDVGGNFSNVGGELWIRQNRSYPSWSNYKSSFSFYLNGGQVAGWDFTYDFRNSSALRLAYVEVNIGHNSDGSKYFGIEGYCNADGLGYTEVRSGITLPTIPRASTASFPNGNWAEAGQTFLVRNNRASDNFYHDTDWYFGNDSGRAGTNTYQDWNWTVPMALLNQIPGATSGVGKIRTHTYNSGNMIGWTETAFGVTAGAGIVPTFTGTALEDVTAGVQDIIGAGLYLQGVSKLKSTITGAAGVYGSTVTDWSHTVGGETIAGATATFSQPISTSGTAVGVSRSVRDTRGRVTTQTQNINVMPYSTPVVSNFVLARVNGSNNADPVGQRLKLTVTAAVQSIVNSTQRNTLSLRAYTKLRSSSTWSSPTNIVLGSTTTGYNSVAYLEGPFSPSQAYDVRLELFDKFNTTQVQSTLATGEVTQHWATGLGVGKYWEQGALDVNGQIYQGPGTVVEPVGVILAYGGTTAPAGWLLGQGQAVSRTTYAALFAVYGTRFGAGNGSSTFNLPDLRRRVPAGYMASDPDFGAMGQMGGHKDPPAHDHPIAPDWTPNYQAAHSFSWGSSGEGNVNITNAQAVSGGAADNRLYTVQNQWNRTGNFGNADSKNNLPPYTTVNYIIRAI